VPGQLVDLAGQRVDLAVEVCDQAQQDVQPRPRLGPQLELGEKGAAAGPEQLAVAVLDALTRDQRVHAVLQRGPHLREHEALAQQVAEIAQLARSDVGLRQQIGTQQLRQCARVNGVGLHPRRRDRLRAQRMRQMQLAALGLEQLGQPLPPVGGLEREPVVVAQLAEQLAEALGVVDQPPRQQLLAALVNHRDMRALAMQVNPDVHHAWASFGPGTQRAPGGIARRAPGRWRPAHSWHQVVWTLGVVGGILEVGCG